MKNNIWIINQYCGSKVHGMNFRSWYFAKELKKKGHYPGATTIMFEGVPTFPDAGRFWEICDKHQVNIFYTAPTAIRALQACGNEFPEKYDLSSLKTLGSVGEPINEEAWHWYNKYIGKEKCSIVDTWWQTETGGILISPFSNITNEFKF